MRHDFLIVEEVIFAQVVIDHLAEALLPDGRSGAQVELPLWVFEKFGPLIAFAISIKLMGRIFVKGRVLDQASLHRIA